jgi:hypothetical protein
MSIFCVVRAGAQLHPPMQAIRSRSWLGRHRVRVEAPRHCYSPSCLPYQFRKFVRRLTDTITPSRPLRRRGGKAACAGAGSDLATPHRSPAAKAFRPNNSPPCRRGAARRTGRCGDTRCSRAGSVSTQPSRLQPATPTPPFNPAVSRCGAARGGHRCPDRRIAREVDDAAAEDAARRLAEPKARIGSHRAMRPRPVRARPQFIVKQQWRDGVDQHEVEGGGAVVRQNL